MKLFITLLTVEPGHFQLGKKTSLKFSEPVYSKFCYSHCICGFVVGNIPLCVCTCACICISSYANKQVNKIGGNKVNKQTFRVDLILS